MIGRFSRPGVYRELLQQAAFLRVVLAGFFALLSLLLDKGIYSSSAVHALWFRQPRLLR